MNKETKRSNQDLAILITEILVDKGLVSVLNDFEYSEDTFEAQDIILDILNKFQPLNNNDV